MRMYIIFVLELRICLKIKTATAITLVNLVEPFQGFNLTFNLRPHHPFGSTNLQFSSFSK